jgi:hypothetical protein
MHKVRQKFSLFAKELHNVGTLVLWRVLDMLTRQTFDFPPFMVIANQSTPFMTLATYTFLMLVCFLSLIQIENESFYGILLFLINKNDVFELFLDFQWAMVAC